MLRRSFRASSHWNVCFTCIIMMMMTTMTMMTMSTTASWHDAKWRKLMIILLTLISQRKWIPLLEMKACRPFCVLTIAIITCSVNNCKMFLDALLHLKTGETSLNITQIIQNTPPDTRLPCYVFCICLLTYTNTNKEQKYKSVELGDQLPDTQS